MKIQNQRFLIGEVVNVRIEEAGNPPTYRGMIVGVWINNDGSLDYCVQDESGNRVDGYSEDWISPDVSGEKFQNNMKIYTVIWEDRWKSAGNQWNCMTKKTFITCTSIRNFMESDFGKKAIYIFEGYVCTLGEELNPNNIVAFP